MSRSPVKRGVLLAALATVAVLPTVARAETTVWKPQDSQTSERLNTVDCATPDSCFVLGAAGQVRRTDDGGAHWAGKDLAIPYFFLKVSCATSSHCFAVHWSPPHLAGTVYVTTDGGATEVFRDAPSDSLTDIHCWTTTECRLVGWEGGIWVTDDAGVTWTAEDSGVTEDLEEVECPTVSRCWVVGDEGTIITTDDAGATWTPQDSGLVLGWPGETRLTGISCPSVTDCFAVTWGGRIIHTTDGGDSWTAQKSESRTGFLRIDCPTAQTCYATAADPLDMSLLGPNMLGSVQATHDGGATWETELTYSTGRTEGVSCPVASRCWVVGDDGTIRRRRTYRRQPHLPGGVSDSAPGASDACGDTAPTPIDGYVGPAYVKAQSRAEDPEQASVCAKTSAGGARYGGEVAMDGSGPRITEDETVAKPPPPRTQPGGPPSNSCGVRPTLVSGDLLNATLFGGSYTRVGLRHGDTPDKRVCFRAEGPVDAGGAIVVHNAPSYIWVPDPPPHVTVESDEPLP